VRLSQRTRCRKTGKEKLKQRVKAATVRLTKQGGQGVLVPGGYILTAAHCIEWSGTGGMALGDHFLEPVETRDGRTFRALVCAAEPVADIAVLCPPDNQERPEDSEAFDLFAAEVESVRLYPNAVQLDEEIPVLVLTHKGGWIKGTVRRYGPPGDLPNGGAWVLAASKFEAGTSGGPVVDQAGRLLGLVSHSTSSATQGTFDCLMPVPCMALPRWLVDDITAADKKRRPREPTVARPRKGK
jgi:S1-C subfamily serine protease